MYDSSSSCLGVAGGEYDLDLLRFGVGLVLGRFERETERERECAVIERVVGLLALSADLERERERLAWKLTWLALPRQGEGERLRTDALDALDVLEFDRGPRLTVLATGGCGEGGRWCGCAGGACI